MVKIDWNDSNQVKKYKREEGRKYYRIKHNIPLDIPVYKVRKSRSKYDWDKPEERNRYKRERRRIKEGLPIDHVYTRKIDWNDSKEVNKYRRELHKNNPNIRKNKKDYHLKKYNLTLEEFEEICEAQEYKCLCCSKDMKNENLYVDHDHITGTIRGLLCIKCNTGIGYLGDDLNGMINAVNYLLAFEKPNSKLIIS